MNYVLMTTTVLCVRTGDNSELTPMKKKNDVSEGGGGVACMWW